MTPLHLSPFPSLHPNEASSSMIPERDGFVDEAVVRALVSGPISHRQIPISAELALAADDLDFAGWCLPPNPSSAQNKPQKISPPRPTPPAQNESGLGEPHTGNHRWWLAGLAGAFTTLLFSLLLLTLSARPLPASVDHLSVKPLTKPQPPIASRTTALRTPTPQLTEIVR